MLPSSLASLRVRLREARGGGGVREAIRDRLPDHPWVEVGRLALAEAKRDQVTLLAAGVAFYTFLSLVPTMVVASTVYGLVADPLTIARQTRWVTNTLPESAADLVVGQMETIAGQADSSLGVGLLASLAALVWTASLGVGNLVKAINMAYEETETRTFLRLRLMAMLMMLGGLVFLALAIGLITLLPLVLEATLPEETVPWFVTAGRWLGLLALVMAMLAVVYRIAPNRAGPQTPWFSPGAVLATVLWLLASFGFSLYVDNVARYGETYGALAGVAVLMLWLWVTMYVILLGAEVNAAVESSRAPDRRD